MVVIRLARGGTKQRPFYYVVVTNSRNARDGRFIERVGFYNPIAKGGEVKLQLNKEQINYWVSKGAQLSERVADLIKNFAEITMQEPATKESAATSKVPKHKAEPKGEIVAEEKAVVEPEVAEEKPVEGA
jgi:small subunit ribosomal protein S16